MNQRDHTRSRKQPLSWIESVFRCCFVMIVALPILLEGGEASASTPVQKGHSCTVISDNSDHHPDCSNTGPLEREVREGESEIDEEDESSEFSHIHNVPSALRFNDHSGDLLFFQLMVASECRTSISLIILLHCWKSFPH
jgi:hypothetical protein